MRGPVQALNRAAARMARMSALLAGAGLMLMAGLAFLTAAGWLFLASLRDPLFASLIVGLIYCGGGLILLAIAVSGARSAPGNKTAEEFRTAAHEGSLDPPSTGEFPPLLEAFIFGLNTALRLRRRKGQPRGGDKPRQ